MKAKPVDRHMRLIPVVIVVAGLLSAYTTADGVYNILREWGQVPAAAAALGFAVILGSSMIYLTFEARRRRGASELVPVVLLYLLVAAVSIFFNFNSIFSAFASQDLAASDARGVRSATLNMISAGDAHLRQTYRLDALVRDVEAARVAAEFEATREDRPGRRQRYIVLKERWARLQSELTAATELYNRDRADLLRFSVQVGPERAINSFEDASAEVRRLGSIHADVTAWLTARNLPISAANQTPTSLSRNRRSVAVALSELHRNIQLALSDTAEAATRFHFWLAVVLSCVLDLLVFAIVLSLPNDPASVRAAAPEDRSEPIRWDPL